MVVGAGLALPVQRLTAAVADGVDAAFLAEHLEVAVDGGEPDVLAAPPQLGVDLLGAAEPRQVLQRRGERRRLPRPAYLRPAGGAWRPPSGVGTVAGSGGSSPRAGTPAGDSVTELHRPVRLRGVHRRTLQRAGMFGVTGCGQPPPPAPPARRAAAPHRPPGEPVSRPLV
jgi:hypothetical protein